MGLSPEVMYNMFDPVGVLVEAVVLSIEFVNPGGISGVFVDAVGLPLTWWAP